MSRICVIGAGRSGAVTAACLAELGHEVRGVDIDKERVAALAQGRAPFHEPGLDALLAAGIGAGRLTFTTSLAEGLAGAALAVLCVNTPAGPDGRADLSALERAVGDAAPLLENGATVVTRSTVPVGTNARIAARVAALRPESRRPVVSNPEFLREGHAVDDFLRPERIVIGAEDGEAAAAVAGLFQRIDRPVIVTNWATAELAKYASNAFLATSVSFINEIAAIAERAGADVETVTSVMRLDARIGARAYLSPGLGFGGSCLPKDLRALAATAEEHGATPSLLRAVLDVNELQPQRVVERLREVLGPLEGRTVAVLGLSFKGGTFDLRSSPAVELVRLLAGAGARVRAFDPLRDDATVPVDAEVCADAYEAAAGSEALVLATDHPEFPTLDLGRLREAMSGGVLVDARNALDPEAAARAGFAYAGVGRPRRGE